MNPRPVRFPPRLFMGFARKPYKLLVLALGLILAALILAACGAAPAGYDPYAQRAAADIQRAAADAAIQATQQAQDAIILQATLTAGQTQSALEAERASMEAAAQATRSALELAQAQAAATQTAEAQAVQATQTAQAGTAQAQAAAAATQNAYPLTATPQAATQAAIVIAAQRAERRAYYSQLIDPLVATAPAILLFVVVFLLIVASWAAYRRLLPVLELRLRTVKRGPHDAPIFILPTLQGGWAAVDPDRTFGPALVSGPDGIYSTGHAPTVELQERVTGRDQAIDLTRALPRDRTERARAEGLVNGLLGQPAQPPALPAQVEIIDPDGSGAPGLAGWLAEVENKLLTKGEGDL